MQLDAARAHRRPAVLGVTIQKRRYAARNMIQHALYQMSVSLAENAARKVRKLVEKTAAMIPRRRCAALTHQATVRKDMSASRAGVAHREWKSAGAIGVTIQKLMSAARMRKTAHGRV